MRRLGPSVANPGSAGWHSATLLGAGAEIMGNIATSPTAMNGSILQAANVSWPAGMSANYRSGSFASPPTFDNTVGGTTYQWGYAVKCNNGMTDCPGTNIYAALGDNLPGSTHVPGTDWAGWTLLNSFASPVVASYADSRTSVQNGGLHHITLDCEYTSGGAMTDGCIGFYNLSAQELMVLNRVMIRNPTIAGVFMEDFVPNVGPFSGQVVYSTPTSGDQAASKVNTGDSINRRERSRLQSPRFLTWER